MSTEKTMNGDLPAGANVETTTENREYQGPEVYDLGKLELLQQGPEPNGNDGAHRYIWRP